MYADKLGPNLRQEGDPTLDPIIQALVRDGQTEEVNGVLLHLLRNDQPIPEALPDQLRTWFIQNRQLPPHVDRARLQRAEHIFVEYGVSISIILLTASLIELYACKILVRVLMSTYRLEYDTARRVGETLQYVLRLMAPGGLSGDGQGIVAIQKVRMMHAAIRTLVMRSGRWSQQELGMPICQEDLLVTLLTFTYTVLHNLRGMEAGLTTREEEDYLYFWGVVGEMMGIRPDIIPRTLRELQESKALFARLQGPSTDGVRMTQALLALQAHMVPGRWFDGALPALTRQMLGRQVANWMHVPRSWWDVLLWFDTPIRWLLRLFNSRKSLLHRLLTPFGMALLMAEARLLTGGARAAFEIPDQLRQRWGLPAMAPNLSQQQVAAGKGPQ